MGKLCRLFGIMPGLLCAHLMLSQQPAITSPPSALVQVAHIEGDISRGFRKSCLIVFSDGHYRHERVSQDMSGMHVPLGWGKPSVLGGSLTAEEVNALLAELGEADFTSISGAVGYIPKLSSMLRYYPGGSVSPNEAIDLFTVSVAHPSRSQVFQVGSGAGHQEPISKFLGWVNRVEKRPAAVLSNSQATQCFSLPDSVRDEPMQTAAFAGAFQAPKAIHLASPSLSGGATSPVKVRIEFVVNPDGTVGGATLKSPTSKETAQAVMDAVRKWSFHPARLLDVPVATPMQTDVTISDKPD